MARTGVRINGASYQTYEEALDWIGEDARSGPFVEKVSYLLDSQGNCPDLSLIYGPARKYVEELFEEVLPTALETELLPEKFAGTNYSDNKQIAKLLNKAGQVNTQVDSNKLYWNFLFEGKTKSELVNYRRIIREIDYPSKTWAASQRNKEYFWALSEGCNWLLNTLDKYIERPTGAR